MGEALRAAGGRSRAFGRRNGSDLQLLLRHGPIVGDVRNRNPCDKARFELPYDPAFKTAAARKGNDLSASACQHAARRRLKKSFVAERRRSQVGVGHLKGCHYLILARLSQLQVDSRGLRVDDHLVLGFRADGRLLPAGDAGGAHGQPITAVMHQPSRPFLLPMKRLAVVQPPGLPLVGADEELQFRGTNLAKVANR